MFSNFMSISHGIPQNEVKALELTLGGQIDIYNKFIFIELFHYCVGPSDMKKSKFADHILIRE